MVHEPELEEGEAFYSKDDANIDPDIALSYIGDKVQSILGHFQKDFEGGVSAENLGAKYGGYGSFLPMYHRSQPDVVQPKSPQRVQNIHMRGVPNHLLPEAPAHNSVLVPGGRTQNNGSVSLPSLQPVNLRTSIEDASMRQKTCLPSDILVKPFPRKVDIDSKKSDNGPNMRTLKVRIKVRPDIVAKYNAEIYNLGLTTPSSSEGNSSAETGELQCESHGSPGESPTKIVQMMTCAPVPGNLLLSPLCEDFVNLTREKHLSIKDEHEASPWSSDKSFRVSKSKNFEEADSERIQQKNFETDTIRIPDMDTKDKKMKRNKNSAEEEIADFGDSVKDASLEHSSQQSCDKHEQPKSGYSSAGKVGKDDHWPRTSQKDVSADHRQVNKSIDNRNSASFEAHTDISKGERFKKAVDNHKVGQKILPTEHSDTRLSQATDSLPIEGCKKSKGMQISEPLALKSAHLKDNGGSSVPKNKKRGMKDFHLIEHDVVQTSSEHKKLKRSLEKHSVDKPKKINLEVAKQKLAYAAGKTKETSINGKLSDKVTYDAPMLEAPSLAVQSNDAIITGLEQTVAAPVLIREDWVACDRCEKWRLLPYGTKSEQLPDKWVCSMLNWLPGMNSCDISEDETTKALQALYLVPICGDQPNALAHDDRTMPGAFTAHFDQADQNRSFGRNVGQVKKLELKEKSNIAKSDTVPFNGKKQAQQKALKTGKLEKVNRSLTRFNNTMLDSDMQYQNTLPTIGVKFEKRKGEDLIGDEGTQRKRLKKLSAQHVDGKGEKIKSKSVLAMDNLQISARNQGNCDQSLKSALPNRVALKNGRKISVPKAVLSGGTGNFKVMETQKHQVRDLPSNRPMGTKTGNERETTIKIKLKECESDKPQDEMCQNNGSRLQDKASIKGDGMGSDQHIRDKKSQASWIREEELRKNQDDENTKGKYADGGARLIYGKDYPSNRTENEQHVKKPRARMKITKDDIEKLRRDLGYEQVPMAATSSTSKVSGTRKKRSYMEINCSPAESVSSSRARLSYTNQISPMRMETEVFHSKNELTVERDANGTESCRGKMLVDLHRGDKKGAQLNPGKLASGSSRPLKKNHLKSRPADNSVADTSKVIKGQTITSPLKGSDNNRNTEAERPFALKENLMTKNLTSSGNSYHALKEAQDVLKEAEELKSHADLIKNSGFISESNYEYLKAALKYLKGASLLEACNEGNCKSLEVNPMQMYGAAAKLCNVCANEYEKTHELAAAALAYKCMEVAYLRVVYCKSSNTSRVWRDLQSSLMMIPQGESPSSSASDVDNLNNLAAANKATLSTCNGSHAMVSRSQPNFVRLLDFTRDVNSAMEAAKKAREIFAASQLKVEESLQDKEAIVCIKKVIDFSFQDVKELVCLVELALNAINHQGLRRDRE